MLMRFLFLFVIKRTERKNTLDSSETKYNEKIKKLQNENKELKNNVDKFERISNNNI